MIMYEIKLNNEQFYKMELLNRKKKIATISSW